MPLIFLIDDDQEVLDSLAGLLDSEGFETMRFTSAVRAVGSIETGTFFPDLIILDIWMPELNGLEFLGKLKTLDIPEIPVIVITGEGSIRLAVKATRLGAFDFHEKPFNGDRLLLSIRNALKLRILESENRLLKRNAGSPKALIGNSPPMQALNKKIEKVSPTNGTVLITGENGTGKEMVAKKIHRCSRRNKFPLIKVNCAAIPETLIESELFGYEAGAFTGATHRKKGRFEAADGGTIFLDEVADMSPAVQSKFLRVVQEREFERLGGTASLRVNIRIIAATNRNLPDEVEAGTFREDLFFRLNVIPIHIPPLRDRSGDIPALSEHFLSMFSDEHGRETKRLSGNALDELMHFQWPGNVRELKNLMERLVIFSERESISRSDLMSLLYQFGTGGTINHPSAASREISPSGLSHQVAEYEKAVISGSLVQTGWNIAQAARLLKLDRANLNRKMKRLDIYRP